jgi:hypothetical protein
MSADLDELKERHGLLTSINELEGGDAWTDLDELKERHGLLTSINELEGGDA